MQVHWLKPEDIEEQENDFFFPSTPRFVRCQPSGIERGR